MAEITYLTEEEIKPYTEKILSLLQETFTSLKSTTDIPEILTMKICTEEEFCTDFYKEYKRKETGVPDLKKYDRIRLIDIRASKPSFVCMYNISYEGENEERISKVEKPALYIIKDFLLKDMLSYRKESYLEPEYYERLKNVYGTKLKFWIGYMIIYIIQIYHEQPYTYAEQAKKGYIITVPIWKNEWKLMFQEVNIELGDQKNKICSFMNMDMISYQDVFAFTELMSKRVISYE